MNPVPGVVGAEFDSRAFFADVDAVVQSFGLTYRYWGRGEAIIRAFVTEGDGPDLRDRVSASPLVDHVFLGNQSYPVEGNFLAITFVPDVTRDEARSFTESYSELEITNAWMNPVYVHFEVPVDEEDAWIDRLRQEALVTDARYVWAACPATP